MKNLFKILISAAVVVGIVFGAVFIFSNVNLDQQVVLELTNETSQEKKGQAESTLSSLVNWIGINGMQATKIKIVKAEKTINSINYKSSKLISLCIAVKEATKDDNKKVLEKYNALVQAQDETAKRHKVFVDGYTSFNDSEKIAQYTSLYNNLVAEIACNIDFTNELNNYVIKYVYSGIENIDLQNALLNIMFELSKNVYEKVLTKETPTNILVNELTKVMSFYNSLDGDYSFAPKSNTENLLNSYKNLEDKSTFFASESKNDYKNEVLIQNQKDYATLLISLCEGDFTE